MIEKELRKIDDSISVSQDSRLVEGYALVFNQLSQDLGGFREKIDPTALDGVIEQSDIFAYLNHNEDKGVLARSKKGKGTLSLVVDEKGLRYSFDSPQTSVGDETLEMLRRGDITSSSFCFTVESDTWEKQSDKTYIRTITKFNRLYDVSPVYQPAYTQTTANLKRFNELLEEESKELAEYYNNLEKQIDDEKQC